MEHKSNKSLLLVVALVGMFGLVGQAWAVDTDGDGVDDAIDLCVGTPVGHPVDPNGCSDTDADGVYGYIDVCLDSDPGVTVDANGCELDSDGDGILDSNDLCGGTPDGDPVDPNGCSTVDNDSDGIGNQYDNCPGIVNPGQENSDTDAFGDVCDNCPAYGSSDQGDSDDDGVGNPCDDCSGTPTGHTVDPCGCSDDDGDGVYGYIDNCPDLANPSQADNDDGDGVGDECDICPRTDPQWDIAPVYPHKLGQVTVTEGCADRDYDGVSDWRDDCPSTTGYRNDHLVDERGCLETKWVHVRTSVLVDRTRYGDLFGGGFSVSSLDFLMKSGTGPVGGLASTLYFDENPRRYWSNRENSVWFVAHDDGLVELWSEGHIDDACDPGVYGPSYYYDPCNYPTDPCQTVTYGMSDPNLNGITVTIWLVPDSDNDDVVDDDDLCPNTPPYTAVDADGCPLPDEDGDGVLDVYPDYNNDGVPDDYSDLCPGSDANFPVDVDGCLDTDIDGVPDTADDCPNSPLGATVSIEGCYDADGDGVGIRYDLCPGDGNLPVNDDGCPDTDGDGVPNTDDLCADPCTWVDENGCPDRDLDGIADAADSCPDVGGWVCPSGCPDADGDGDGVLDCVDLCDDPCTVVNADGCIDLDQDGLADANDACLGTPAGAPIGADGCHTKDVLVETDGPLMAVGSSSPYVQTFEVSRKAGGSPYAHVIRFSAIPGTNPNANIWFRVYPDGSTGIWDETDLAYWHRQRHRPGGDSLRGMREGQYPDVVPDAYGAFFDAQGYAVSRVYHTLDAGTATYQDLVPWDHPAFNIKIVEDVDSDYDGAQDPIDECPGLPEDPNLSLVDLVGCPIWPECDDPWRPSSIGDITGDCYVNENDVRKMSFQWLACTHPLVAGCVQLQLSPLELEPNTLYMPHWPDSSPPNINGDLDEAAWTGSDPCWMDLIRWYIPGTDPCDIVSAKYALFWGGDTTDPCMLIYAAVIVDDRDHVLKPATNWNTCDRIEIYVQGDPNGGDEWGSESRNKWFDKAQQYAVGEKGPGFFGADWGVFGNGTTIPGLGTLANAGFKYEVKVKNTTELHYEIQAKAWVWYGGRYGGASEARRLEPGMQVGFDIIADSRYSSPPEPCYAEPVNGDPNWDDYHETYEAAFGMLSANMDVQKYIFAENFQRWELKNYDGTNVAPECGDWGYLKSDVFRDSDCEVALADFIVISNEWMDCTDPCAPCGYNPF